MFATSNWSMSYHNSDSAQRLEKTAPQLAGLINSPNHEVYARFCLVSLTFLSKAGLIFLSLALGLSSGNKLSLLLSSVFASSMVTWASTVLLLSGVFLPFMCPDFFQSSYNCFTKPGTLSHALLWSTFSICSFLWKCHGYNWSFATWQIWSRQQRQPLHSV